MSTRTRQDWILWAQLGCALVATAHAEYTLVTALDQHLVVAGAFTGALDLYVVRALQKRKDVLPAVLVMVAANVVSILVGAGVVPVHWAVLAAVGALAPLLVWRGHVLRVHSDAVTESALMQVKASGAVDAPEPEYEDDTCRDDECMLRGMHSEHALEWIPDVLAEEVHPSEPQPELSTADAAYLAEAKAYLEDCALSESQPSVRGLRKWASVGQDRAERLLEYLGVRKARRP